MEMIVFMKSVWCLYTRDRYFLLRPGVIVSVAALACSTDVEVHRGNPTNMRLVLRAMVFRMRVHPPILTQSARH